MTDIVHELRGLAIGMSLARDTVTRAANEIEEMKGNALHLLHQLDQAKAEIERLRATIPSPGELIASADE